MENTKPWWMSRTIWTSFAIVLVAVLGGFGLLPPGLTEAHITEAIMAVLAVLAVYFRYDATEEVE